MFEDFNCKPEWSISFWNTKITPNYTLFRMPCVFKQHSKCELIKFYSPYLYPGPSLFGFSSLSIPKSPTKWNEKWSPICSPLLRALYSLSSSSPWSASLTVMTASTNVFEDSTKCPSTARRQRTSPKSTLCKFGLCCNCFLPFPTSSSSFFGVRWPSGRGQLV